MLSAAGFLNVPLSYIGARMKMETSVFIKIRSRGRLEKVAINKINKINKRAE